MDWLVVDWILAFMGFSFVCFILVCVVLFSVGLDLCIWVFVLVFEWCVWADDVGCFADWLWCYSVWLRWGCVCLMIEFSCFGFVCFSVFCFCVPVCYELVLIVVCDCWMVMVLLAGVCFTYCLQIGFGALFMLIWWFI